MIKLENVTKVFTTDEIETTAVDIQSLVIETGEFVAIMGPSGCGKSTLLNILGMIDSPTAGSYQFAGKEMANLREHELSSCRKAELGFVFQSFNLIDDLTVKENIELALLYNNTQREERETLLTEIMEKLNIAHRADHFPQQLSGGQQQRVAVARALVTKPTVILADEPTGNLDSQNGKDVMKLFQHINASGTTVVMVTHSETDASYASRVLRLSDGSIRQDDQNTTDESLLNKSA